MLYSLFFVGENKLPQLEVTENDSLVVTRLDGLAHLPKETLRLCLTQSLTDSHIGMQITLKKDRPGRLLHVNMLSFPFLLQINKLPGTARTINTCAGLRE